MKYVLNETQKFSANLRLLEDVMSMSIAFSPPCPVSQRVLDAIAEIDGRPYNPETGTFAEGLSTNPRAKLQMLDMAESLALPDGELPPQFAFYTEV
jgi:hypothetical protein